VKEIQADPWVVTAREKSNMTPAFAQVKKKMHRRSRAHRCNWRSEVQKVRMYAKIV